MSTRMAHDSEAKWRSDDAITNGGKKFSSLHLDERILAGLSEAGYIIPSKFQLKAIPLCQSNNDVFLQGKAGAGKTLVFSILALTAALEAEDLQVLIIAPTHEGAYQIYNTIKIIGSKIKDLNCECFIGGSDYNKDIPKAEDCKIAVGTPGRLYSLIREEILDVDTIRLFVLDDIDVYINNQLEHQIIGIYDALPVKIQTIVTSLTSTDKVLKFASEILKYTHLTHYCEKELPPILGMAHYYHIVPVDFLPVLAYRKKLQVLQKLFFKVKFTQCIIFSNSVIRVEMLSLDVQYMGFTVATLTKGMDQVARLRALEHLKKNQCKVFIATNVGSRCVDSENVDLVVNFDIPDDHIAYYYRAGRAGRYGAKSSSITLLTRREKNLLKQIENKGHFKIYALPEAIPENLNCEVTIPPSKLPSSGCNSGVTSLIELSKKAAINLEKPKAGESCLLTATEEQTANIEIDDTNLPISDLEIKPENEFAEDHQDAAQINAKKTCLLRSGAENAELPGKLEIVSANQSNIDIENTEAINTEHDSTNYEESSCKTAHTPYTNEATVECGKENVSGALSSEWELRPLNANCKNLIERSNGEASETVTIQNLNKADTGSA